MEVMIWIAFWMRTAASFVICICRFILLAASTVSTFDSDNSLIIFSARSRLWSILSEVTASCFTFSVISSINSPNVFIRSVAVSISSACATAPLAMSSTALPISEAFSLVCADISPSCTPAVNTSLDADCIFSIILRSSFCKSWRLFAMLPSSSLRFSKRLLIWTFKLPHASCPSAPLASFRPFRIANTRIIITINARIPITIATPTKVPVLTAMKELTSEAGAPANNMPIVLPPWSFNGM